MAGTTGNTCVVSEYVSRAKLERGNPRVNAKTGSQSRSMTLITPRIQNDPSRSPLTKNANDLKHSHQEHPVFSLVSSKTAPSAGYP